MAAPLKTWLTRQGPGAPDQTRETQWVPGDLLDPKDLRGGDESWRIEVKGDEVGKS